MTPTEAAMLLTIAASYDNRKPDADQAKAWAMVLDDLRFVDARDAVVQHFKTSRDWMMPVDVRRAVQKARRDRVSAFGTLPNPPRSIDPDDTAAMQRWHRDTLRRIADGETVAEPPALPAAPMPAGLAQQMRNFGRTLPIRTNTTDPECVKTKAAEARAALRPNIEETA